MSMRMDDGSVTFAKTELFPSRLVGGFCRLSHGFQVLLLLLLLSLVLLLLVLLLLLLSLVLLLLLLLLSSAPALPAEGGLAGGPFGDGDRRKRSWMGGAMRVV